MKVFEGGKELIPEDITNDEPAATVLTPVLGDPSVTATKPILI